MLGAEFDSLSLAVVAVIDLDNAATRFIDNDAIRPAIVLIEIPATLISNSQGRTIPLRAN